LLAQLVANSAGAAIYDAPHDQREHEQPSGGDSPDGPSG
jgi:hypothetical protein